MTLDEDIKIVGMPHVGVIKVVQLFLDGHPVMLCGPMNVYHKDILQDYLKSQGIEPESVELYNKKLPALKGDRYEVVGMGKGQVNQETDYIKIPPSISVDYKIRTDEDFGERLKQQFSNWKQ